MSANSVGEVTLCGEIIENPGMSPGQFRTLDDYGFVYVYSGNGEFHDKEGQSGWISAGSLIYLWPGAPHNYRPTDGPWSEVYFLFRGPVFDAWRKSGVFADVPPLRQLSPVDAWLARFRELLRLAKQDAAQLRVICDLQRIWAETAWNDAPTVETDWASRAQGEIRKLLMVDYAVKGAAQELGMGYESFRKRFAQECGISPGQFHLRERLLAAALRLESSDESVSGIAEAFGFCDAFHFSRQFKAQFGHSPLRYRQRQRVQLKRSYPTHIDSK